MTKITDLLDIQQAARFLNVSETSLRRWTNDGRLTCLRLGKKKVRRFRHEDLLAFMLEQKAELSPSRNQNGGRGLQAQGALSLQAHLVRFTGTMTARPGLRMISSMRASRRAASVSSSYRPIPRRRF